MQDSLYIPEFWEKKKLEQLFSVNYPKQSEKSKIILRYKKLHNRIFESKISSGNFKQPDLDANYFEKFINEVLYSKVWGKLERSNEWKGNKTSHDFLKFCVWTVVGSTFWLNTPKAKS